MIKTRNLSKLAFLSALGMSGCSQAPVRSIAASHTSGSVYGGLADDAKDPDKIGLSPDEVIASKEPSAYGSQCVVTDLGITQGQLVKVDSVLLRSTVKIRFQSNIYCTGTLVGPRQVITAAHCLKGETPTEVRFGLEPDKSPDLVVAVKWWIAHPDYNRVFDIGMILLKEDVPPQYLYTQIAKPHSLKMGMTVYYAGYGTPSEENKNYVNSLAWTSVPLESINVDRKTFSTAINGKGSCYGDSGGPGYIIDPSGSCLLAVGVVNSASTKGNGLCGQGDTSFDVTQAQGWIGDSFKTLGAPLPYEMPLDGTEAAVSRNILGAPLP